MNKIAIINGANLNRLGVRDPMIYGDTPFSEYLEELYATFPDIELSYFQSNHEGEIIDALQKFTDEEECKGVVINPGAFAHYSYAIADAVRDAARFMPVVEVHISNIHIREEFRRRSVTGEAVNGGVISGCGLDGYRLAILHILQIAKLND